LHHLGCLVDDMQAAIDDFQALHGPRVGVSEIFNITSQQVRVCFLAPKGEPAIEFVEPYLDNKRLRKMLSKGISFYHVGYESQQYDAESVRLLNEGFKKMADFKSAAFQNKRCCFFLSKTGQLIELIESS